MNTSAYLQVIVSFIAGGGFITLLSLIAEKTNEKLAGIIMMFPSTIVLGYLFLGWTSSAQQVADVAPATIIPLGLVVFTSVIYISIGKLLAKHISNRTAHIAVTFSLSCLIWLLAVTPIAIYKPTHLAIGIVSYVILASITYYILNRTESTAIARLKYSKGQVIFRAVFIGTLMSIIVILGKTAGVFWGGIFTMFPAATFSTLMIFHYYYDVNSLHFFMKRAPIGSISIFVYILAAILFFPKYGLIGGTILCYLCSMATSILLLQSTRRMHKQKNKRL